MWRSSKAHNPLHEWILHNCQPIANHGKLNHFQFAPFVVISIYQNCHTYTSTSRTSSLAHSLSLALAASSHTTPKDVIMGCLWQSNPNRRVMQLSEMCCTDSLLFTAWPALHWLPESRLPSIWSDCNQCQLYSNWRWPLMQRWTHSVA